MNDDRTPLLERLLLTAFLTLLFLALLNFALGGIDAVAHYWKLVQDTAYAYATWQTEWYVWVLVPILLLLALLLRESSPTITVPLVSPEGEVRVVRRWYRPGSFRIQDGVASWREWGGWASVDSRHISRLGALCGYGMVFGRRRHKTPEGIVYEKIDIEPYVSQTLLARLRIELQRNSAAQRRDRLEARHDRP